MIPLLLLLAPESHAAACVCSRGVALPSIPVQRAWAGVVALDYGVSLASDPNTWEGFSVVDEYGDSMAGMYMPPHLVQTASLSATLGLPTGFSASATLPYMYTHHLGVSEMRGDVDSNSLADADVTARWGTEDTHKTRWGALAASLTFPTGEVVADTPVRAGRGVFGTNLGLSGGLKVDPHLRTAAQLAYSTGFGADSSGYIVAPTASAVLGLGWTPRENGKFSLAGFAMERWSGKDQEDALVYKNTGYWTTDLGLALNDTFWANELRSASFNLKAQLPVYQVVGDPMYAENFSVSAGVSVTAF